MLTKVDIKDLSNFILFYCNKNQITINHFKLQKLLYYTQAWHLVYFDKNNIFDELPEAWVNGPVYRSVYNDWRTIYANANIEVKKEELDNLDKHIDDNAKKLSLQDIQKVFLGSILNYYGLMSHDKLIMLTHQEQPWNEARAGLGEFEYSNNKISIEVMYNYYKGLQEKNTAPKS